MRRLVHILFVRASLHRLIAHLGVFLGVVSWANSALAAPTLETVLTRHSPASFFSGATKYEPVQAAKLVRALDNDRRVLGHVFLNTDFDRAIGYSGKPISILIGIDPKGKVAGAKLVAHAEPIVLAGIPEAKVIDFISGYKNLDVVGIDRQASRAQLPVDIVSGATVTVLVIDDSIRNSSVAAARAVGLIGTTAT